MSEIRVTNVTGENGNSPVNFTKGINMSGIVTATAFIPSQGQLSHRNTIINGAHAVAQRGSAAVTVTTSAGYRCVDRFKSDIDGSGGGDWSHAQSTDVPAGQGFRNSSKITTVTQASQPSSTGNRHQLYYQSEKQDVTHLEWGTSAAKTCTLSFWVKSSVAGIYPLWFQHYSSGGNKYYYSNYTINATNTWEKKTITVTGSTSGGNVSGDTSVGLRIEWGLGYGSDSETGTLNEWTTSSTIRAASGSVYLPENAGATWYLTGCQFEVGSVATPFEHRTFGEEKRLCMRYYQQYINLQISGGYVPSTSSKVNQVTFTFPVEFRANPTASITNTGSSAGQYVYDGSGYANITALDSAGILSTTCHMNFSLSGDLTNTRSVSLGGSTNTANQTTFKFTAEL